MLLEEITEKKTWKTVALISKGKCKWKKINPGDYY